MLVFAGCGSPAPQPVISDTPENAYRQLMLSMLMDDKEAVGKLVVDASQVNELAEGRYPKEVEPLLANQYQTMEIWRSGNETVDRVELKSSAFPFPLTAIKYGDSWKIDARPIVESRQVMRRVPQ